MRSYIFAVLERGGISAVKLASILVLARFVTPAEFGLFSIVSVITAISLVLVDSGMGGALIREENPTELDYSTVFFVNIAAAAGIYLLLFLAAPYVAKFYDENRLILIIRVLSLSLFARALTVIQISRLIRDEKFGIQAAIYLCGAVLSFGVAYILAVRGLGIWALIAQQLLEALFVFFGFFCVTRSIPQRGFATESLRRLGRFGFNLTLSSIVRSVYDNLSVLIIAKIYSTVTLGFFSQANRINNFYSTFVTGVVDKVAFSTLSKKFHENHSAFLEHSDLLYARTAFVGSLGATITFFLAPEIVGILLGADWQNAGKILQLLGLCGFGVVVETASRVILKSAGASAQILRAEFLKKGVSILILVGCAAISFQSILYGLIFASLFALMVNMVAVRSYVRYPFRRQFRALVPAMLAGGATFLIAVLSPRPSPILGFFGMAYVGTLTLSYMCVYTISSKLLMNRFV